MLENLMDITFIVTFLQASIRMAAPLALAGIGETFSERSGILNIGLEGIMLSGAFFGFLGSFFLKSPWLGLICGAIGGLLISLLHGYLSINLRTDQVISGIAINLFVLGLTSFFFRVIVGTSTTPPECNVLPTVTIPVLNKIPIVGMVLFKQDVMVYMTILLAVAGWFLLFRTMWGLNILSVGEHPKAADTVGLNVFALRYQAVFINGLLSGMAGAYLSIVHLGVFMENITQGRGFIALAVVILGKRNPLGVLAAALLFGAADAFQFRLQTFGSSIPSQAFIMIPYVITVVALLGIIGRSEDPSALGIPYNRDVR